METLQKVSPQLETQYLAYKKKKRKKEKKKKNTKKHPNQTSSTHTEQSKEEGAYGT